MKLADNTLKTAREFFYKELEPIWGEEVNSLFFIWWNEKKGWTRSEIQLNVNERLSESELLDFLRAIKRLKVKEPIQYILGSAPFGDCQILVNPNVLIPRPETEEIVYHSIGWLKEIENPFILDLCTGSGCIALALKNKRKGATVFALDISEKALESARKSAGLNNLEIHFFQEDVCQPKHLDLPPFDMIISNPPYVLEREKGLMNANVLDFEPHLALFVKDEDPLLFYRKIVENYIHYLKPEGLLVFEINEAEADSTRILLEKSAFFESIEVMTDLQGKKRMIRCVKKGSLS